MVGFLAHTDSIIVDRSLFELQINAGNRQVSAAQVLTTGVLRDIERISADLPFFGRSVLCLIGWPPTKDNTSKQILEHLCLELTLNLNLYYRHTNEDLHIIRNWIWQQ